MRAPITLLVAIEAEGVPPSFGAIGLRSTAAWLASCSPSAFGRLPSHFSDVAWMPAPRPILTVDHCQLWMSPAIRARDREMSTRGSLPRMNLGGISSRCSAPRTPIRWAIMRPVSGALTRCSPGWCERFRRTIPTCTS